MKKSSIQKLNQKAFVNICEAVNFTNEINRVSKDSISVVPTTIVITVNTDSVNILELSDGNNIQHKKV